MTRTRKHTAVIAGTLTAAAIAQATSPLTAISVMVALLTLSIATLALLHLRDRRTPTPMQVNEELVFAIAARTRLPIGVVSNVLFATQAHHAQSATR